MDLGLSGKTALITGGARGIGRAIALALAAEGVHITIADLHPDAETLAAIRALGVRAESLTVDVRREEQVVGMVEQTVAAFGALDLYVNNAGRHWHEPVSRITTENWTNTLDTNLTACMWACREVVRHMIGRRQGSILIVTSTITLNPGYREAAYRAAKLALKGYAETLALELGPYGIRVNTLAPGIIQTALAANVRQVLDDPALAPQLLGAIPIGRIGVPEDCGRVAAMLLSEAVSRYVTGAEVVVDGGFTGAWRIADCGYRLPDSG